MGECYNVIYCEFLVNNSTQVIYLYICDFHIFSFSFQDHQIVACLNPTVLLFAAITLTMCGISRSTKCVDLGVFLQLTMARTGAPFTRPARSVLADSSHGSSLRIYT